MYLHDKFDGVQHAWKAEYIIVDNAKKCNVNFHYGLIEPDKQILTYVHFKNSVLLAKSMCELVFQTKNNNKKNIPLARDMTAPE